MIEDAIRLLSRTAGSVGRRLPVGGAVFGRERRLALDGRVVFVTGAARGLGAEIARQAHARGAHVAVVGRRLAPLEVLAAELGDRAVAFEADVADLDALARAATATAERFGGIDVVVANAGIAPPSDTVLTIDPAEFERTVDVDLLGQWRTVRATLPAVIERRGHVLVVSSIYAFFNGALNASYAMSKAGIEQLTRALRVELAPHGVTAGVAYLGFIDTELAADVFAQEQAAEMRKAGPAFLTAEISREAAARAVLDGIERRASRVGAPAWVLPMLAMRGMVTTVMDEVMVHSPQLMRTIRGAEQRAAAEERPADPPVPEEDD
jgi:NAD(P)-dependent dehydrogenase (short-subunit alcohol dehydrogenase family)